MNFAYIMYFNDNILIQPSKEIRAVDNIPTFSLVYNLKCRWLQNIYHGELQMIKVIALLCSASYT